MNTVFVNHRYVAKEEPCLLSHDRGFLLGDGLFETLLVHQGALVVPEQHLARLKAGLAVLDLPVPWAGRELLSLMQSMVSPIERGWLRLTISRGPAARGLSVPRSPEPTLLIDRGPLEAQATMRKRVMSSSVRRNETSPLARLKTLNALDAVLALREAQEKGFSEALFLNTQGKVVCTTHANLFLFKGEALLTPPIEDGVLPGITRALILKAAASLGCPCLEVSLERKDVLTSEGMFLTNSLGGLMPVTHFDDHVFPSLPSFFKTLVTAYEGMAFHPL